MVGEAQRRLACWVAISALLAVAPACGPDGFTAPWLRPGDPAAPYVVNRPAYADGARPFFVSGYAGANYEPFVGGPRGAFGVPLPAANPPPALPVEPPPPPAGPMPASPADAPGVSASQGSWETE